jgi:predicted N-acetyltransferase YhbS
MLEIVQVHPEATTPLRTEAPGSSRVVLRPGRPEDAAASGQICFDAFKSISTRHSFPRDFPSADVAAGFLAELLSHSGIYSVVAETDGRIVGSNFLDERSVIAGVGPITVDPDLQDGGVGRMLMNAVLVRAAEQKFAGVRLVQAAYHTRSLALYARLGFQARKTLACLQGSPLGITMPGRRVRQADPGDLEDCDRICRAVHGHDRSRDVEDAIRAGSASVVELAGRVTGYATAIAFFGHAVGESTDDVKALIGAAPAFGGPGILVPADEPLLPWCLEHGLRITQLMTLMTIGLYTEPAGSYLPSVIY